jgi:hypothetical protein
MTAWGAVLHAARRARWGKPMFGGKAQRWWWTGAARFATIGKNRKNKNRNDESRCDMNR